VSLNRTDSAVMPSGQVQYQIDPDVMTYVSYRRGFKAGGFNGDGPLNSAVGFDPEHVNAYEVGLKSKWLDQRLLVNFDVFRQDFKDLQVNASVFQPSTNSFRFLIANAAASVSQGAELESSGW